MVFRFFANVVQSTALALSAKASLRHRVEDSQCAALPEQGEPLRDRIGAAGALGNLAAAARPLRRSHVLCRGYKRRILMISPRSSRSPRPFAPFAGSPRRAGAGQGEPRGRSGARSAARRGASLLTRLCDTTPPYVIPKRSSCAVTSHIDRTFARHQTNRPNWGSATSTPPIRPLIIDRDF